jgi:hypothetical protein
MIAVCFHFIILSNLPDHFGIGSDVAVIADDNGETTPEWSHLVWHHAADVACSRAAGVGCPTRESPFRDHAVSSPVPQLEVK